MKCLTIYHTCDILEPMTANERKETKMNTTTSTLEPQTADYQAAVDNVWFEISKNARQQITTWSTGKRWEDDGRISYIVNLEMRMELALGRKNNLGYSLENF